jgi:uncharacterized protein DUF3617
MVVGLCLLALPMVANAGITPGKYQVTVEMEMAGMDKMPSATVEQCITKEEAENPQKTVLQDAAGKNNSCKVSDLKVDGNTISWKVNCEKEQISGEGKMTLESDSYSGTVNLKVQDRQMTQKFTGKRLGDCQK